MNGRVCLFLAVSSSLVASSVAIWIHYQLRARRLYGQDWKTILAKVVPLDGTTLKIVALDFLGDVEGFGGNHGPCELDSAEILKLTGGLKGLRDIETNCDALIELACYCQRLYPEALVVAEELRLNAREIKWHLDRLDTAERNGKSAATIGEYAQRIATIYYLMTNRLLALYDAYDVLGAHEVRVSFA